MSSEKLAHQTDSPKATDTRLELYEQAVQNSPDLVSIVDKNYMYQAVNSTYLKRYVRTEDQIVGHSASEVMGQEVFEDVIKPNLDRALAGETLNYQAWFAYPELGKRYMDVHYFPLLKDNGPVEHVAVIVRDITEHKRREEVLREGEQRFRSLAEMTSDWVWEIDQDGIHTYSGPKVKDLLGYEPEEVIGKSPFDLMPPDEAEQIVGPVMDIIQSRKPFAGLVNTCLHKDGRHVVLESSGVPIFDECGNLLVYRGIDRDITERKRMEEALRLSEERHHRIVDSSHDMICVMDDNAKTLFVNRAWRETVGYTLDEINDIDVFDAIHPDDRERTRNGFQRVIAGESARNFEYRSIKKDGRIRWLEANGGLIHWPGVERAILMVARDITERKKMEEALKESEERYRNIFHEAPDIFYTLDLETWTITDANTFALEILEYGPEMIGKIDVSKIIHPDDYERATNRLREMVAKKDRMPNFPLRILTRTGKVRHIEQSGVIFWDENGRANSFLGLARDVTERKKKEEMIRKRNEKLAALYEIAKASNESLKLNTILEMVTDLVPRITDSDMICIYTYDELTQTLIYSAQRGLPDEFIRGTDRVRLGEGLHGYVAQVKTPIILGEDARKHSLVCRRSHTTATECNSAIIVPLVVRDKLLGTLTVGRRPGNPYDSEDLELVSAMANQIAIAMENANLYSQILQREAHLESILQTSRDGIAVLSSDRRVIYRNRAISSMFGYTEADNLSEVDTMHFFAPESHFVLEDIRGRLNEGGQIEGMLQFKGRRKDGTAFDAEARLGHYFENGKRLTVAVVRDVTERKRMEFQLHQSSKLAAIGELAAGVAHEINNPTATINVQTGLMRDILEDERGKLDKNLRGGLEKCLSAVEEQVRRCQSVTNNLLSFSRVPESKQETFGINELLKKTVKLVIRLADKKPKVEMILDERLPLFRGDPNLMQQVFVNLLSNALKATDSDGSIALLTRLDEGGNILIEFRDSGLGIAPEIKDRVFDPFFTTRPGGEGTGLGLSVSYYIIKQMNGRLDVESSPGQGTSFTIILQTETEATGECRP